jgi:hypothetical protein
MGGRDGVVSWWSQLEFFKQTDFQLASMVQPMKAISINWTPWQF